MYPHKRLQEEGDRDLITTFPKVHYEHQSETMQGIKMITPKEFNSRLLQHTNEETQDQFAQRKRLEERKIKEKAAIDLLKIKTERKMAEEERRRVDPEEERRKTLELKGALL